MKRLIFLMCLAGCGGAPEPERAPVKTEQGIEYVQGEDGVWRPVEENTTIQPFADVLPGESEPESSDAPVPTEETPSPESTPEESPVPVMPVDPASPEPSTPPPGPVCERAAFVVLEDESLDPPNRYAGCPGGMTYNQMLTEAWSAIPNDTWCNNDANQPITPAEYRFWVEWKTVSAREWGCEYPNTPAWRTPPTRCSCWPVAPGDDKVVEDSPEPLTDVPNPYPG